MRRYLHHTRALLLHAFEFPLQRNECQYAKTSNKFRMTYNISDKIHRNSVPRRYMSKEDMKEYLKQLMAEGEQWKAIKMVVLGNGRIGKTTLLHSIRQLLTSSQLVCLFLSCFDLRKCNCFSNSWSDAQNPLGRVTPFSFSHTKANLGQPKKTAKLSNLR